MAHTIKRYWWHTAPQSPVGLVIYSGLCTHPLPQQCQKQKAQHASPLTPNQRWGGGGVSAFRKKCMDKIHVRHWHFQRIHRNYLSMQVAKDTFSNVKRSTCSLQKNLRHVSTLPRRCNGNEFVHSSSLLLNSGEFFWGFKRNRNKCTAHISAESPRQWSAGCWV